MAGVLQDRPQPKRPRKLDDRGEARLIAPRSWPQTRTVGGTLKISFTLPEPANAGGGPKKVHKTSNPTKINLAQAKTKKATKLPPHTPRPQSVPTRDPSQEAG